MVPERGGGVTTEEARERIGHGVVYRPYPGARAEDGTIHSISPSGRYVFVLYTGDRAPKATDPADLELLAATKTEKD